MRKNTKLQSGLDLMTTQNSNKQINCCLKKLLHAAMPKITRKLFTTAALLTLLSVKIGGGGQYRYN
jgi:hypothetical protein